MSLGTAHHLLEVGDRALQQEGKEQSYVVSKQAESVVAQKSNGPWVSQSSLPAIIY